MNNQLVERLKEEHSELGDKINKLSIFIDSGKKNEVGEHHFTLLKHQLDYMKAYASILSMRICDLTKE